MSEEEQNENTVADDDLDQEGAGGENVEPINGESTGDNDAGNPDGDVDAAGADNSAESGEIVVLIDGETAVEEDEQKLATAPEWVRDLRKTQRELQKKNRELEAKLREKDATPEVKAPPLGVKPTLEGHDYDTEQYEAALEAWHAKKRDADAVEAQQRDAKAADQREWQKKLNSYNEAKKKLKVKDYDDAESVVLENLDVTQQGIVLQGAEDAALIIYALGRNPVKAAELAAIKDPVRFAFAIAKLETKLKVSPKKPAPPAPERRIEGSGAKSGTVDSTLDRLRAEAEKTGDISKVVAYKRKLKKA